MKTERVEADVLVVGGGTTGLMAAIHARECGAKVIVADKCNTLHSGSTRAGNDDISCYIPEVHGPEIDDYIKIYATGQAGRGFLTTPRAVIRTQVEHSFEIVKLWDSWGIPMRYKGKYEFCGHRFPGLPGPHLKMSGAKMKQVMTEQALMRGVVIMNRVMVVDLFGDNNRVTGALGVDTREDRIVEFAAKAVVLGTGGGGRLYPGITPGLMGNCSMFTVTGDGRAMAYRLGAELVEVEMGGGRWGTPQLKNFLRAGKGTWIGVYRYPDGKPVGPFVNQPDKRFGDATGEVGLGELFDPNSGKGPIWMDVRGVSDDDLEYMEYWLFNEGNKPILDHMREEGIDLRKHQVEFHATIGGMGSGRIGHDEKAQTSIKGLYAGGGEGSPSALSGAAVYGWLAGENAAKYAKGAPSPNIDKDKAKVENWKSKIEGLQTREYGPDWKDANMALQHAMQDYCGAVRSDPLLETGLTHLRRLKKKVHDVMRAEDRWQLTRCLEVINMYDIGEVKFQAALERKESRMTHHRADYAYANPLLNGKVLISKNVVGEPVFEWRDLEGRPDVKVSVVDNIDAAKVK